MCEQHFISVITQQCMAGSQTSNLFIASLMPYQATETDNV